MLRKLLLFDIDGTLLLDDAYATGHAMEHAAEEVYGVLLDERAVALSEPWGKTDRRIIREVLRDAGLNDERIDAKMDDWMQATAEAFEREADRAARWWRVRDHAVRVLKGLADGGHTIGLLSGDLEAIAHSKIRRMGLESYISRNQGAFGSEHEVRAALVPLARKRAGRRGEAWPSGQTVLIGDTPSDVSAALADGVTPLAFASARFDRRSLVGATIIERLDEIPALL